MTDNAPARAVIVGGGFAGVACARKLAASKDLHVTLIDKNDYHQFQPLLYQVATSMLAARTITYPLRKIAADFEAFDAKRAEVVAIDPVARTVTTSTGETYAGDYIVLAAGSQPNFFGTPGAEHAFPLYSLDDADRLRTRIIQAFEEADRDPHLVDEGAIDFVIVGGGPTGVEVAGALSEMINTTMVHEFPALAPRAKVRLVDHGKELLKMFADKGHAYAARILEKDGVELLLGTGVKAIGPGHVTLSDGSTIKTRCVIWGGGLMAAPIAGDRRASAGPRWPDRCPTRFHGRGLPGRPGHRRHREHPGQGRQVPSAARLGRAAEWRWAAKTILADRAREERQAVLLPRQGDHGDDRPRRRGRAGQGRRAARQDGVRGLAGRPCRAHDRGQQPRRRVQELGAWTSSARTGRRRRSTGAGPPA